MFMLRYSEWHIFIPSIAYIYPIYRIVSITSIIMFMLRYSVWHIFIPCIASYLSHRIIMFMLRYNVWHIFIYHYVYVTL